MSADNLKETYIPRLLALYRDTIIQKLKEEHGYTNTLAVPRLVKISINMGLGEATADQKIVEKASSELGLISGQKPKICRSRKPISNFKLREGIPIGCCVTLRRARMYEFLDRLITVVTPRIRDFRGLPANSFDGNGNYTFGLTEQSVFPELELDRITRAQGMNITLHTTATTDEEARSLMKAFSFPFRR